MISRLRSKQRKIITILGARPQFIKTPLVSQEISKFATEILVHTGQHYDDQMSGVFFRELGIKKPKYNLAVGSGDQGQQTGQMLEGIEKILLQEKPDLVLIYGDTNSTIAGALAASKLHIPVAHVEAGMRSYNRQMPEEINRVVSDHISSLLFCPTKSSVQILKGEGISKGVYFVGDVMADIQHKFQISKSKFKIMETINIKPKNYLLATIHRQENTDKRENLENIVEAIIQTGETIIWPLHPRTKKALELYGLDKKLILSPQVRLVEPLGFKEMMSLEMNAKLILTDSGGVQKEAYLACVPCITLRNETEWQETVQSGWNQLSGCDIKKILKLVKNYPRPKSHPNFLGNGRAYQKIAQLIQKYLNYTTK